MSQTNVLSLIRLLCFLDLRTKKTFAESGVLIAKTLTKKFLGLKYQSLATRTTKPNEPAD